MSTSIDISTNEIAVTPSDSVIVETDQNNVCVQPYTDIEVTGSTKEYTIIGDAIFASQNVGEAPQWLTSIIDSVIGAALDKSLTNLAETQRNLITSIEELGIANNNYNEIININATVDEAVTTRLAALNANVENANATIAELQTTKASATEASAIALDVVSSSLNDTAVGTVGGTVSQLNSSISTLAGNVSSARTLVESRYGELNEAIADLDISVNTAIDGVSSKFAYNSTLKVGDKYYKTGFGLKAEATTGGSGTQADPYSSEFWIDATRFKFTNSNATGSVTPFTIDASGGTPKISFNGTVSFNNVTGDDKPEPGATRNEFRGAWTSGAIYRKGDIVTINGNSWGAKLDHTATSGNRPPIFSTGLSNTWLLNAAKGDQGVSGIDARSVSVTASDQTIEYDSAGNTPNPSTVVLTAASTNTAGNVYYEFIVDGTSKQNGTDNTYTHTLPTSHEDMPIKVEVRLREGSAASPVLAGDVTTLVGLKKGSDGISVILSNEAHVVPADSSGNVLSFAGSGTTVEVWQGTTQLSYGTSGNGTFSVTAIGTSVTVGDATTSGNLRVYDDIGLFSANTGKIDFTITVRGIDGVTRTITKKQTFAKSLQGLKGIDGAAGADGAEGVNARSVALTATRQTIKYNTAGVDPSPVSIGFAAESFNTVGSVEYRFFVNNTVEQEASSSSTFTLDAPLSEFEQSIAVEVEMIEDGIIKARDQVDVFAIRDGADVITVVLTNESHTVPADADGNAPDLAGSGTRIRVFEGSEQLIFNSSSPDNPPTNALGKYNVARTTTGGLSGGVFTGESTGECIVSDFTAFTEDIGISTFTIRVRRKDGNLVELVKEQSLSKSKRGIQGVAGAPGATGAAGSDARKVDLIGDVSAIAYNADGGRVTNSVNFTAFASNTVGTPFYEFFVNDQSQGTSSSKDTFTYTPPTTFDESPISVEVQVREGSSSGTIVARDEVTLVRVKAGSDAISATLSNEAHVFAADVSGVVSSYSGSGTSISVFQGATKLQYEAGAGSPTTNGKFRITVTAAGITAGGITVSTTDALVGNASNMTADVATLVYTIHIRNSNGAVSTVTKTQSFSKSKTGATGLRGPQGAKGNTGAAGQNAKVVKLVASKTVLKYSVAGEDPAPTSIIFTAIPDNTSGTLSYRFYKDDVETGPAAAINTYTYTAPSTMSDTPTSVEVELYEDSVLVARDEVTVVSLRDGSGAIVATLSNEAHVVPSSSSGDDPALDSSGTTLRVFEGTTPLTFVGTGNEYPASNAKGTYSVERVLTGLTAPDLGGLNTTTLTQADYTGMTADVATAVFNIRIRRLDGTEGMLTKVQTLSKSRKGTDGEPGPTGQSTVTIYRNITAKPDTPAKGGIPSNWYTYVPTTWTGNVWRSEGTAAAGSSDFVWGEPYLDFTSWRASNSTKIDGGYIETNTVTALQIASKTITTDEIDADNLIVKKLQANVGSTTGMVVDTINGYIKVYDADNKLRVQIGNLSV